MSSTALAARGTGPAHDVKPPTRPDDFAPTIIPRDPLRDPALGMAAANVEHRILDEFCRGPDSYCFWATDKAAASRTGLSVTQLRYGLERLASAGRIFRFRSPRKYQDWLDTVGSPVYGVRRPDRMVSPGRIVVFARRLPPAQRDPAKLWPLGIGGDEEGSAMGTFAQSDSALLPNRDGHFCPIPSYMNSSKGTLKMESTLTLTCASLWTPEQEAAFDAFPGSPDDDDLKADEAPPSDREEVVPLPTRPDRTTAPERPIASPVPTNAAADREEALGTHFGSLCDFERATLRKSVLSEMPHAARLGEHWIEMLMIARLEADNPALYPPIAEAEPTRAAAAAAPPRKPTPAELVVVAIREAERTRHPDLMEHAVQSLAAALKDQRSLGFYRRTMRHLAERRLTADEICEGFRLARCAGVVSPGRIFNSHVSGKLRPETSAHGKTALGAIDQDHPESGQDQRPRP